MCDLNRVSGFLIAAKVAFLVTLVLLGIGMANSASLFAAAANVPLMIAAIVSTALATAMYVAALAELDQCANGPCAQDLQSLRSALISLLATMAVFTGALIAITVVAAIPFAGAAVIGGLIASFIGMTAFVAGGLELNFAQTTGRFNACREQQNASTISGVVIAAAYVVMVAAVLFSVGGALAGKIPVKFEFDW